MKKIELSDRLELSQVVMGCMRIADAGITEQELLTLVETCLDMGVTSIDHAPVYGGYTCEKICDGDYQRVAETMLPNCFQKARQISQIHHDCSIDAFDSLGYRILS